VERFLMAAIFSCTVLVSSVVKKVVNGHNGRW